MHAILVINEENFMQKVIVSFSFRSDFHYMYIVIFVQCSDLYKPLDGGMDWCFMEEYA